MAEITAAAVKAFRERTGLPMMDCKKALIAAGGDEEKAVEELRKSGEKLGEKRADRETAFGRFGLYVGTDKPTGAMVELKCESAPVTQNEEFIQLSDDLAEALAKTPGIATAADLLALPSPSKSGSTLEQQRADLFNRIRENFVVGRFQRYDSTCGGYSHNAGTVAGVLVEIEGGNDSVAKDVAMHVAAMSPAALSRDEFDSEVVAREREILKSAALAEGKPESIVEKMVEGRMGQYFAERALLEQAYVKDDKQKVGAYAEENGMKIKQFVHYVLGEASEA